MPLKRARKGASRKARQRVVGQNMHELTHKKGGTYARTKRKFGKARALKQAIAISLKSAGLSRKRKKR